MTINPIDIQDTVWLRFLQELLPSRYQQGNAGIYYHLMYGLLGDTVEEMTLGARRLPYIETPYSPSDILRYIADENGIPPVTPENEESYRDRIWNWWEAVRFYGTHTAIEHILTYALPGSNNKVIQWIPAVHEPIVHPTRPTIPAYPSSSKHWSQFIVVINTNTIHGTGVESNIVSDKQLQNIRGYISLMKPVDWVCREIVIVYNPLDVPIYNKLPDPHVYDEVGLEWQDENVWSDIVYERHIGQNNMRID